MRITPDLVLRAPQRFNCCGQREILLRGLAAPCVESLGVLRDSFDLLDLSQNALTTLGTGFPPSPRLVALYVGANAIRKLENGLADTLPNLRTLILTANAIHTIQDLNLPELEKLRHLETIAIADNPVVANTPDIRLTLLRHIPSLRFIDFLRVTRAERLAAAPLISAHPAKKKHSRTHGASRAPTTTIYISQSSKPKTVPRRHRTPTRPLLLGPQLEPTGDPPLSSLSTREYQPTEEDNNINNLSVMPGGPQRHSFSEAQIDQFKAAIAAASSLDQIAALQRALRTGNLDSLENIIPKS